MPNSCYVFIGQFYLTLIPCVFIWWKCYILSHLLCFFCIGSYGSFFTIALDFIFFKVHFWSFRNVVNSKTLFIKKKMSIVFILKVLSEYLVFFYFNILPGFGALQTKKSGCLGWACQNEITQIAKCISITLILWGDLDQIIVYVVWLLFFKAVE